MIAQPFGPDFNRPPRELSVGADAVPAAAERIRSESKLRRHGNRCVAACEAVNSETEDSDLRREAAGVDEAIIVIARGVDAVPIECADGVREARHGSERVDADLAAQREAV